MPLTWISVLINSSFFLALIFNITITLSALSFAMTGTICYLDRQSLYVQKGVLNVGDVRSRAKCIQVAQQLVSQPPVFSLVQKHPTPTPPTKRAFDNQSDDQRLTSIVLTRPFCQFIFRRLESPFPTFFLAGLMPDQKLKCSTPHYDSFRERLSRASPPRRRKRSARAISIQARSTSSSSSTAQFPRDIKGKGREYSTRDEGYGGKNGRLVDLTMQGEFFANETCYSPNVFLIR